MIKKKIFIFNFNARSSSGRCLRHFCHRITNRNCIGLLTGWKVLECLDPLTNAHACCKCYVIPASEPFERGLRHSVGKLVCSGSKIKKLRYAQLDERFWPHLECTLAALFHKYHFPFFFSSRRRHTSCLSDWSSDVCSSD